MNKMQYNKSQNSKWIKRSTFTNHFPHTWCCITQASSVAVARVVLLCHVGKIQTLYPF